MKASKKRIALSGLSILLVLSLLVGGTMAWFTDTEKVNANFAAGVLDISVTPDKPAGAELEFKNLRPLTLDQFDAELKVNEDGSISNTNQEGFSSYTPVYFQPVTVHNGGTLPAVINFSVQDMGPMTDDVINVVDNGTGGVKQDGVLKCNEAPYVLKEVLQIVVYENTAAEGEKANWVRVEGVNLNETAKDEPQGYTLPQVLGADESVQYVIGGYLPDNTGNKYQAKHFHGWFTVNAYQADDPGAGEITPPEKPVTKDVEVKWAIEDGTPVESTYTHKVTFLNGATETKLFPNTAKLDNRYELVTVGDFRDITLDKEAGTVDPASVTFTVKLKEGGGTDPDPDKNPEAYQVLVKFVDKENQETVYTTKTYSGLVKGAYLFKAADAEGVAGNVYSVAAPDGYEYDPAAADQQEQNVAIPVENGPAVVTFTVKVKEGGTDPDPGEHPKAYQVRVDFVDKENTANVLTTKVYSGLVKGTYLFKAADVEGLEDTTYLVAVPDGYEYDPVAASQQEQSVSIPVENGPAVVTFTVKVKQGGTDPEEPDNPDCPDPTYKHVIKTAADFDNIRNHPHCKFILADDIDLSTDFPNWTPIGELNRIDDPWNGTSYEPSENVFTGDLNGNGKSITGMNVGTLKSFNGLFSYSSGTIHNLKLDGTVNAHSNSGMLVGWNQGKIENCSISGNITAGDWTKNIWEVGGIVGWNDTTGVIKGCSSSANVKANPGTGYQATAHYYYGGLTGSNNGTLINSYSTGTVKGARAGGLCGYNSGSISYCYTTSKVYALTDSYGNTDTWTHPTVGEMENGTTEKIIANTVFFQKGNLYRNNQVYTGWDTDKYRGLGKTADEMQTAATYTGAGWNSSIWNIADGGYPTLK